MYLTEHLQELNEVIDGVDVDKLDTIVDILRDAKKNGTTVYTFGNGGSHSTASHFACDLLKACGIKAFCVSDMIPSTYAFMNDDGVETMFDLVIARLDKDAILIGFSCSGNSSNVYHALLRRGKLTVLFTGAGGGIAETVSNVVVRVPNKNIRIQESAHMAYCHAIVEELLNDEV